MTQIEIDILDRAAREAGMALESRIGDSKTLGWADVTSARVRYGAALKSLREAMVAFIDEILAARERCYL